MTEAKDNNHVPAAKSRSASASFENPKKVYHLAHTFIRADDIIDWRQLAQRLHATIKPSLKGWRAGHESSAPAGDVPLVDATNEAVALVASSIAMALAGVESTKDKFKDQRDLFDELYHISEWSRSGRAMVVELPAALGFIYQALHGAVCLSTGQPELAVEFATMIVRHGGTNVKAPLWKHPDLIGRPKTLGSSGSTAWGFLIDAFDQWDWLQEIFGDLENYKIALTSYYILLNFIEYMDALKSNMLDHDKKGAGLSLKIPILFSAERPELIEKAVIRLGKHPEFFDAVIKKSKANKHQVVVEWNRWLRICENSVEQARFLRTDSVLHADLLVYLGWKAK